MEKPWNSFPATVFCPATEKQKAAGETGRYENRVYSRDQIETIFSEMNKFQQEKLENKKDNEKTLDSKQR
ncbi:hypothetical protein STAIW_v1c07370 [Spiroplasma taiwanense CT-1]|uniref:Uncharacterized protein n=2 Tax=Spiroplasma taiwanense TaxID=2145 RepID=S5LUA4_9MOLU|nr:hypothetical protein STAIW_v1c07370 [Spiroplasma taiwanense CT-1]